MHPKNTLHILTGPTAIGKTELSLLWAEKNNAEILSCDSTLVYKGMDIGTAKPTSAERTRISHHGIDLVSVNKQFSIKDYLEYSLKTVQEICSRGKNILITGGSGFYLKSFFDPVLDSLPESPEIKATVEKLLLQEGLSSVVEKLKALNPGGVGELDLHNPRRVTRALERCLISGKSLAELQADFNQLQSPFASYPKKLTLLTRDEANLKARVSQRVKQMLKEGLVDEVKVLLSQGILDNPSAANAIGYRETIEALNKNLPLEALELSIIQNTFKLLAKQRKWFRHQIKPTKVLNLDNETHSLDTLKILF